MLAASPLSHGQDCRYSDAVLRACSSRWGQLTLGLLLVLSLGGCGSEPTPPNVLLITLDTTRADRLGCYGHTAAETTTLDALATSGARFEHAYAHTPLTLASHATILTGLHAREHGIHVNGGGRLASGISSLAERFSEQQYRAGAFVSSFVLDEVFGLARGFDEYDDRMGASDTSHSFESERPANRVTDAALSWLRESEERPFFAWVHYYDPHSGYAPPAEYSERLDDPYDGELAFVDDQLARIVEHLDATGLRENTLIVVAGDHGEAFGEHDERDHGLFVYDTTLRVPLIVTWPGQVTAGTTPTDAVGIVDIYATVLELALNDTATDSSGRSLVPLLNGARQSTEIYAESRLGQIGYGWAPLRSLVRDGWKYIHAPTPELYDLNEDPGETSNQATERSELANDMLRALRMFERAHEPRESDDVDLDGDAMARLRSLGYVGGTDSAGLDLDADLGTLRDPKDMLSVFQGHLRAIQLIGNRQYGPAAALLERLLAESPESLDLYENLGFAYLALGRAPEAEQAYLQSLTRMPKHAERLWGLGEALRRQNRQSEAIAAYEAALTYRPTLGEAHMALGQIYSAQGDLERALEHARRHVEINPGSSTALKNHAELAFMSGDVDLALEIVDRWIRDAPQDRAAHNARWQALNQLRRRDETIAALRDSLETIPDDWNMLSTLAWLLATSPEATTEEAEEAIGFAARAATLNDANPRSHDVLAAAYASAGDFEAAIASAEIGLQRARSSGAGRAGRAIESRLQLYRSGRPYHR